MTDLQRAAEWRAVGWIPFYHEGKLIGAADDQLILREYIPERLEHV